MKTIRVIIKDKNTLVLDEPAEKGDIIDLTSLTKVDFSSLEKVIEEGNNQVYKNKLEDYRKHLEEIHQKDIEKLRDEKSSILKEQELLLSQKENEIKQVYDKEINDLKSKLDLLKKDSEIKLKDELNKKDQELQKLNSENTNLKQQIELKLDKQKSDLKSEYQLTINKLESQIELNKKDYEYQINQKVNELNRTHLDEVNKLNSEIDDLKRQRSSLNVKRIGEDLEIWCNNLVTSYMQNGLSNCLWYKDNQVIKNDDENKGSKADYILKVYADSSHKDSELLTSICFDMKSESPSSVNKKTNADYFKALDKNRTKKNCKYAVLVSELEMEQSNSLSIYKVNEYEDMYVVRPSYLMIFINMIVSLTTRFQELILTKKEEELALTDKIELVNKFDEIKKTYLDKPLETLKSEIESIMKLSGNITELSRKIEEHCEKINLRYINEISSKIDRFEIQLNRINKKF